MPETTGQGTALDLERKTGLVSMGVHLYKIVRSSEHSGGAGPYWRFIVECQDGDSQGRQAMLQLSHSPDSRFRVDEFLDAVRAPQRGRMTHSQFVGKMFKAKTVHEPYEGVVRANLYNLMPYDGQLPLPTEIEAEDDVVKEPTGEIPEDTLRTPQRPAPSRSPFG